MIIKHETTGSIDALKTLVSQVSAIEGINGLLILSCDENHFMADHVDPILTQSRLPLFGGIFPAIVHGKKLLKKGNIVVGLTRLIGIHSIPELSNNQMDYEDILDKKIPDLGTGKTMIVFVDGFAKRISDFIESLFSVFGLDINYIGGGAGSVSMQQKPCLFTQQGLMGDCAVIGLLDDHSGVGVNHGWTVLNGPYRVSQSEHNTIKTLDWKPAFEVYHEVVSSHAKKTFTHENFFEISKAYPFGIARMDNEQINQQLSQEIVFRKQAEKTKNQFLANMSHELLTPMNGIIGLNKLLMNSGLTGNQFELTNDLSSSAESLLNILKNLFEFSLMNAEKQVLETVNFDLHRLVSDLINEFSYKAVENNLKLHSTIDPNIPQFLMGDVKKTRQILVHLIDNAIKFTESDTRKYGGIGLGLAICKKLIQLLSAHIELSDSKTGGLIFIFSLPMGHTRMATYFPPPVATYLSPTPSTT
jgi:hypothetical protein